MKYSSAVVVTVIASYQKLSEMTRSILETEKNEISVAKFKQNFNNPGFSTCVSAQKYNPPGPKVIQEQLNLTLPEFVKKCQTHKGVVAELTEDRDVAAKIAYALSDEFVKEAKKSSTIDDSTWDQLTKDKCLGDVVLVVVNDDNVAEINDCFEEAEKLKGEKRRDFANALLQGFCAEVKRLAKEKNGANKN